jgi:hypothetical protein
MRCERNGGTADCSSIDRWRRLRGKVVGQLISPFSNSALLTFAAIFVVVNLLGEVQPLLGNEKPMGFISELRRFLCLLPTLVGLARYSAAEFTAPISISLYQVLWPPAGGGERRGTMRSPRSGRPLRSPVAKGIRAAERESRIWKGEGNSLRRASGDECGDNAIGE